MKNVQLVVSRKNLYHNYSYFKSKLTGTTKLMALVKANAYGMGDIQVASLMQEFGADYLAVAFPCEGIRLKEAGIKLPILVLTPGADNFDQLINYGLEPSIVNEESFISMVSAVKRAGKTSYPVHIKFDSGMQRVGFNNQSIPNLKSLLSQNTLLEVKSLFSHLAAADEPKHDIFTLGQIESFKTMANQIEPLIANKPMRHILNSFGTERFTQHQMDMVRIGIGLYGTSCINNNFLKTPATFKAPVIHIKEVTDGTIGYGRHGKVTSKVKKIATVGAGYADGVNRRFSRGNLVCMLNGKPVATIGNVSMDTFMLDITGADAKIGDQVIIFGENPSPAVLAETLQTITYEIFTSVSARVERVIGE